jgi:hypothetical protein
MNVRHALRGEAPFVLVIAIVAFGFCYMVIASGHWLRGVTVVAAGLIVGGVLRAVLPNGLAGLLAVRSRFFDVLCYLGLGVAVFGFGVLVPR